MNKFLLGSLNLSKIPKNKIKEDKNGNKWLNVTVFFNEEPDERGNNLAIKVYDKEDGTNVYIGNAKFYAPKEEDSKPKEAKEPNSDLPF